MAHHNSQDRIQALVDAFVQDLTSEIRNSAMESVAEAIGSLPTTTTKRRTTTTTRKGSNAPTRKRRGRGRAKRSSIDAPTLLKAIKKSKGERTEVIARDLGVNSKSFKPVLDELITSGAVVRKGKARGSTLHVK